jgi:hypothetical protein
MGFLAGCSSQYPTLTYTSADNAKELIQPYAISAMSRDSRGDWDVVLVSQGLEKPRPLINRIGTAINPVELFHREQTAGKDLTPATSTPVRQVVHMKLHWRPQRGSSPNNPAAANATIRWLVFGPPQPTSTASASDAAGSGVSTTPPAATDVLEYQGTAFVAPDFERNGYTLHVLAGSVAPVAVKGDMTDALGPAHLEGTFYVPDDPYTVTNILRELPPPPPAPPPTPSPTSRPAVPTTKPRA